MSPTSLPRAIVSRLAFSDACFKLFRLLAKPFLFADMVRRQRQRSLEETRLYAALPDALQPGVVLHGPFAGMRYPGKQAAGSSYPPKILGCYERELHPIIGSYASREQVAFVDVGCAEGYYAVGFAITNPTSVVYAFDTDQRALALCDAMALLNGVKDRVVLGSCCDPQTLLSLDLPPGSLIMCDCEGYERELFTPEVAAALRHCDLLIEAHDFLDPSISTDLETLFSPTHTIRAIQSLDDVLKPKYYAYHEIARLSQADRFQLLAEHRPCIMEWLYLTPRQRTQAPSAAAAHP